MPTHWPQGGETTECQCPQCTLRREADLLKTHERRLAAIEAKLDELMQRLASHGVI